MSRFDEAADRVLEAASNGANLRESCERAEVPYATVRSWISSGRRDPDGTYGAWVRRLDAFKAGAGDDVDVPGDEHEPGPVESRVDALLRGRELNRQVDLAGAQAKVLARAVDELGCTPGGAAKQALVSASRRLEELTPLLEAPREDLVEELRRQRSQRRGERPIDAWAPNAKRDVPTNPTEASDGKPGREVEIEQERRW